MCTELMYSAPIGAFINFWFNRYLRNLGHEQSYVVSYLLKIDVLNVVLVILGHDVEYEQSIVPQMHPRRQ